MDEVVDVVVVGLGVAGEQVAGRLAEAGLSVVGIEGRLVGGECPYWACVPSKMMIRAANLLAEARRIPGMAGSSRVRPDWSAVATRIRVEATDDWNDKVAVERLVGKGVRFVRGWARLAGPGRVEVDGRSWRASRGVVLATGSRPVVPPIAGLADTPYWTNREAVAAEVPPASLIVLGGGAIGLELAQVYARFGVPVQVVEAFERVLAVEEPESSTLAAEALARDGVAIRTGTRAVSASHGEGGFVLAVEGGDELLAERLLVATGRRADLGGIAVDTVGLDPGARSIPVDDRLRAGERLWALGDVTGVGAFTHVAMYQASIAVRDILGQGGPSADYRAMPRVVFTDPEIGAVGMTEAQARDAGVPVQVGFAELPSSARGWIHKRGNEGFIKLVADARRGVLVGATSAGPAGGEVLAGLAVAVHGEVPVERLRHMIYAYPTFHRAIEDALSTLR